MTLNRNKLLGLALGATLVLVGWTAWRDRAFSMPDAKPTARTERGPIQGKSTVQSTIVADTGRDLISMGDTDPFAPPVVVQPATPKTIAPPPPPPAPPVAPVFPYRYLGRMADVDGTLITYLVGVENTPLPIRPQQVLDGTYRIDGIDERRIVITYLPLQQEVIIPTVTAAN